MNYILLIAFVFIGSHRCHNQISPTTSSVEKALLECLESQMVNEYILDHTEKDTILLNLYGYELPEQYMTLSNYNNKMVWVASKAGEFDNDEIYLRPEELSGINCQTRNQLDCVVYNERDNLYHFEILFRCNATIVRSIYKFKKKNIKLKSRIKSRY